MKEEGLQKYIVHLVLDEMSRTEEVMNKMGLFWTDKYRNSHCLPIYYEASESDMRALEEKYNNRYSLVNAFYNEESIGVPLVTVSLEEDENDFKMRPKSYEVGFGKIEWYSPGSHGIKRELTFNNDGLVEYSKQSKSNKVPYTYHTSFNVLTNDFKIDLTHHVNNEDIHTIFQIMDDRLIISFNGEGKVVDLETGEERDILKSKLSYDRSVIEEAIEKAISEIKTIKGEIVVPGLIEKIDNGLLVLSNLKYNRRR